MATSSKKTKTAFDVTTLDVAILLLHINTGARHPNVGFEDTRETVNSITHKLNQSVTIDRGLLESALWSSNLMAENDSFWHPKFKNFPDWVKHMLGKERFNRIYNIIED